LDSDVDKGKGDIKMTIRAGAGLGTGFSLRLAGNDKVGTILLTTGIGSITGVVFFLDFTPDTYDSKAFSFKLYSLNSTAEALSFSGVAANVLDNKRILEIYINSGLTDSTIYQFAYRID
jgi:hypothetical protein